MTSAPRTFLLPGLGLLGLGLLGLQGCSALPDWRHLGSREVHVVVDYDLGPEASFVVLPSSNEWLKVLDLRTQPGMLRETFDGGERRLYVPPEIRRLRVLCHYKLYRRVDRFGRPLPWPEARDLFPGARVIRSTRGRLGGDEQE